MEKHLVPKNFFFRTYIHHDNLGGVFTLIKFPFRQQLRNLASNYFYNASFLGSREIPMNNTQ
jgi:hypothetical protein